ncbi:MAG: hypothetical protein ACRD5B_03245 [Nitrososphaeraceae archaeon]
MQQLITGVVVVAILSMLLTGAIYTPQTSISIRGVHQCPPPPAPQGPCEGRHNALRTTPNVTYPTYEELFAYLNETGGKKEFTPLSNSSQGFGTNVQTAIAGNTTWIAWEGNVNGTNNIFLKVSYNESLIFTPAVKLSSPDAGNASKLSLAASEDGNLVYAAWQDTNLTTGKNRIFVSSSMNGGEEFRTYTLNLPEDADSIDPKLTVAGEEVIITWIQNGSGGQCSPDPGTVCQHGRW